MTVPAIEPPGKAARSSSRYAEIIREAAQLFRERGYAGTTVRDLAKAVGVTSGNLFHHFGTKEAILLCVVEQGIGQAIDLIERKRSTKRNPRSRMAAMIGAHLEALLEGSPETKSIMFYEWWSLSEAGRTAIMDMRDRYEAMWDAAIAELQGKTSKPERRRVKRLLLFGAMNWTTQWYRSGGSMSVDDLTKELMDAYF